MQGTVQPVLGPLGARFASIDRKKIAWPYQLDRLNPCVTIATILIRLLRAAKITTTGLQMPTSAVENCSEWSPNKAGQAAANSVRAAAATTTIIALQCNRPIIRRHGVVAKGAAETRILGTGWAWSAEGRNFCGVDRKVRL